MSHVSPWTLKKRRVSSIASGIDAAPRIAKPPITSLFTVDHEPDRGVATRLRLLDRLATDRVRLLGAHLPAPGAGFVERKGGAYRFAPAA